MNLVPTTAKKIWKNIVTVAWGIWLCYAKQIFDPQEDPITPQVHVEAGDIVVLTLGGNVLSDIHGDEITRWIEQCRSTINALKEKTGREALCITHVSAVQTFDDGAVNMLKAFADLPESRGTKTAVVGGSLFAKMALRTIILLTGRSNLKPFATKEDAPAWLTHDSSA